MEKKVIIIGGGLAGLSSACYLAKAGYAVTVIEKNSASGGRANYFEAKGFKFDMGPSWYLMPDIFEHFFSLMEEDITDYLTLQKLDPSYRIFFKEKRDSNGTPLVIDVQSDQKSYLELFENIEPGSAEKLLSYLKESEYKYHISKKEFLYRNADSIKDFFTKSTLKEGRRLHILSRMHTYVAKFFSSPLLQKILEYQLVFLGSSPYKTPALYSIMNHIDFNLGVFYPREGIIGIPRALESIARKNGVQFLFNTAVNKILVENDAVKGIVTEKGEVLVASIVIGNADMHHLETRLLDREHQTYPESYWKKKVMAPSAFILYLGVRGTLPTLTHHNLLFSEDWKKNFQEIFDDPKLPTDPSLYVCNPSKSDPSLAPPNCENLFVLVPIPAGINPSNELLDAYEQSVLSTLESEMGINDIGNRIDFKRRFCLADFKSLYNAYKGTGLGLAHTLTQTALLRPNNISKKVKGLYYAGANTNPGIGMPICLISGELVYKRIAGITTSAPLKKL